MPEAGEVAPVVSGVGFVRVGSEHVGGELGGPEGDFIEVAVGGIKVATLLAGLSLALGRSIAKGRKQQLPFGRVPGEIRMGVGVGRHDREMGVVKRWQLGMLGGGCQIEKSIFCWGADRQMI